MGISKDGVQPWWGKAACNPFNIIKARLDLETADFYMAPGGMELRAMRVCWGRCPVRVECLRMAMRQDSEVLRDGDETYRLEPHGIFGGFTEQMRTYAEQQGWAADDPRATAYAMSVIQSRRTPGIRRAWQRPLPAVKGGVHGLQEPLLAG